MDKENATRLESLLQKVANLSDLEICSLKIQTNQSPIVIKIIIKTLNGNDISLNDCEAFNTPDEWLWWFKQTGYKGDYSFIYFE